MFTTRRTFLGATGASAAILVASCGRPAANSGDLHAILNRISTEILREAPEASTALAVSEEQAGGRYIDRLSDVSRESLRRQRGLAETALLKHGQTGQRRAAGARYLISQRVRGLARLQHHFRGAQHRACRQFGRQMCRHAFRRAPSYTALYNMTGLPALSIPCGFDEQGLPYGLQIAGRPFAEATVLQAGHAYERATGWYARHPTL